MENTELTLIDTICKYIDYYRIISLEDLLEINEIRSFYIKENNIRDSVENFFKNILDNLVSKNSITQIDCKTQRDSQYYSYYTLSTTKLRIYSYSYKDVVDYI